MQDATIIVRVGVSCHVSLIDIKLQLASGKMTWNFEVIGISQNNFGLFEKTLLLLQTFSKSWDYPHMKSY